MQDHNSSPLVFPKGLDTLKPLVGLFLALAPVYLVTLVYLGGSPSTTDVGYQPRQPVAYSHALHAGELGIDCRYCHTTVETTAKASIPPTETCMNCHTNIYPDSEKLAVVRESHATGMPIPWIRVHDLPDYVYFDHSAHVRRGVGCVECHDRVDRMEVVYQAEKLTMNWCLDCHRNPEPHLREPALATAMDWRPEGDPQEAGRRIRETYNLNPSVDCGTCHR